MDNITRREVLKLAGIASPLAFAQKMADASDAEKFDRDRMIAAGFTAAQADCMALAVNLKEKLSNLPILHAMDEHELSHAIHQIQYRILARQYPFGVRDKSSTAESAQKIKTDSTPEEDKQDRARVLAAGFTSDEADCWSFTAKLTGKLLELPRLLEMDDHEIVHAIHTIQYRILARPTYRKYREVRL
jgi:hypothetical protein